MRPGVFCLLLGFLLSCPHDPVVAGEARSAPDFNEVYDLVRQHLSGISAEELNQAAVRGLLSSLGPKVTLGQTAEPESGQPQVLVSKTSLFDGPVAYVRV